MASSPHGSRPTRARSTSWSWLTPIRTAIMWPAMASSPAAPGRRSWARTWPRSGPSSGSPAGRTRSCRTTSEASPRDRRHSRPSPDVRGNLRPVVGFLLTGDTVYPGRLYGFDMPAFVDSMDRLVEFAKARPVTHVMGCHIEMSTRPGRDYPIGANYQPQETAVADDDGPAARGARGGARGGLEASRPRPRRLRRLQRDRAPGDSQAPRPLPGSTPVAWPGSALTRCWLGRCWLT